MKDRVSKPKVFLSHSSLDKEFINKLAGDLRKCQIDPWVDVEEIRDGSPWLKVIFEDGMPACDAILAYFTENSLSSNMVAKEIDAAQIRQLEDAGVSFLPYVNDTTLRGKLRIDIQSLQCREWNENNYHDLLPTVVAEIWRSYLERKITEAVLQEKNRRLEVELEMKALQAKFEASAFAPSEERDFQFIFEKLNRDIEITFTLLHLEKDKHINVGKEVYQINLITAFIIYFQNNTNIYFHKGNLAFYLRDTLESLQPLTSAPNTKRETDRDSIKERLSIELLTFGLVKGVERSSHDIILYKYEFTEKMYRLKYWLEFYNYIPKVSFLLISRTDTLTSAVTAPEVEDSELTYAVELDREVAFKEQRDEWRTSDRGVHAAQQEIKNLQKELERLSRINNEKLEKIKIDFRRENENQCFLSGMGVCLSVRWICKYVDSLNESCLLVEEYKGVLNTDERLTLNEEDRSYTSQYTIDIDRELKIGWIQRAHRDKEIPTEELANRLISNLRGTIRNIVVNRE